MTMASTPVAVRARDTRDAPDIATARDVPMTLIAAAATGQRRLPIRRVDGAETENNPPLIEPPHIAVPAALKQTVSTRPLCVHERLRHSSRPPKHLSSRAALTRARVSDRRSVLINSRSIDRCQQLRLST
jgi:hypothetical protein